MKACFIVLLYFPFQLFAQTDLLGKFCSPPAMAVQCITFHPENTFEEQFHGCIGSQGNFGTYTIKGNALYLHFDNKDTSKNRYTEESINLSPLGNDSIEIRA